MSRLGTESAFEVLARAKALERQGKEIIHLEIGEPDFDTPAHIREAAKRALDGGATHYGPAAGLPELREAIAKDVGSTRNIPVSPDEIVVTPGAKPIMYFVITALVNPGDEVIYPNPGFPIYESVINFVGGVPVPIPLREETGFGFDLDLLERRAPPRTKLIIINSPQNPTGGVLEPDQLGRIAEIAKRYRIPVLADEIYKSFLYDGEFTSITRFPGMDGLVIILDGFSKAYAMTGWRLGYGVMPQALAGHVTRLMVNSNSCTASFTQLAGIAALQGDQTPVAEMVAELANPSFVAIHPNNQFLYSVSEINKGSIVAYAIDAKTGKPHYAGPQRLNAIPNVFASPVGASGRVYFPGREGTTVVIRNSPTLEVLATNVLDDGFDASPALVDREIYLRGNKYLYCITAQ
jgi:aspartate/methionine/tyrosine aminotransferase